MRWSQILFALHCLTEALSRKYKQAKFTACINKLNVTEVSCLHWQWICLPGFKWLLHPLMLEHKTNFIMWSKLTNYTSFPSLTVEVGEKLLFCSLGLWVVSKPLQWEDRYNAFCLFSFRCSSLGGKKATRSCRNSKNHCLRQWTFLCCSLCSLWGIVWVPSNAGAVSWPALHHLGHSQGNSLLESEISAQMQEDATNKVHGKSNWRMNQPKEVTSCEVRNYAGSHFLG